MFKRVFISIFILLILCSCGVDKEIYNSVVFENEKLKNEIMLLNNEIDELRNGASRLLSEMKIAYSENDFGKVKENYEKIKEIHFDSPEFIDAEKIYNEVLRVEEEREIAKKQEEERIQREEEERREREYQEQQTALSRLTINRGNNGYTWYISDSLISPFYHGTDRWGLISYFGVKNNSVIPRLKIMYIGSSWIFFDEITLEFGNEKMNIPFNVNDKKTFNYQGSDKINESIDLNINDEIVSFLKEFSKSEDARLLLQGKTEKLYNISVYERNGILDVVNGYYALK